MGRRQERKQEKKRQRKKRGLLGISVLAVLCAGYLLTCSMTEKNTILDGVQINGTEVGGLTVEQAADRVQTAFEEEYGGSGSHGERQRSGLSGGDVPMPFHRCGRSRREGDGLRPWQFPDERSGAPEK